MKSTVVDESLSSYKPMYCSREYQTSTRLNQQYEKSTLNYKEKDRRFKKQFISGIDDYDDHDDDDDMISERIRELTIIKRTNDITSEHV